MDNESFYHFIVLVSSTSNRSGKLNCFNRSSGHIKFRGNSLLNCLQLPFSIFDNEISTYFTSQQMAFHYSSFDKYFSSLSKHDKSSAFLYIRFEVRFLETALMRNIFDIWQGNLEELFLDGMYGNLSKFVVLKHFGWNVLHKECSAPFLFTIYMLKRVFCKDNSVEYGFDRCVEF